MTTLTKLLRAWSPGLTGFLILAAGCGSTPVTADADQARQTLIAVLDAWKSGDTPEALAARLPAIHVSDADWKAGVTLASYKAADSARPAGYDLGFPVVLELKDPKAKVSKKTNAVYIVSTHPRALVLRQDAP
jgi:hypothetical protein